MPAELLAFGAFMRMMRPCLTSWSELGPIHDDIVRALLCPDPNVVLLASRGSAKSTITAMFATWKLWRDPENEMVLIISRAEIHAKRMLKAVRSFMELSPLLSDLLPDDDQVNSAF